MQSLQNNRTIRIRSPTLQTVLMVEEFIDDNSGEYKKSQAWKKLPKKVMWPTFQVVLDYLESLHKIVYDKNGYIVYTWNQELVSKYKNKKELEWNPK